MQLPLSDSDDEQLEHPPATSRNLLRMAVIARLVTEVGISQLKVPLALALADLYFHGKVDVSVGHSVLFMIPKELQTAFMYDFTLLKKRLKSVPVIHLIPDLTQLGGEERLGIMASFAEKVDHEFVNSYACLFSGAVTSKEAAEQFAAAAHTFRDLEP